MNYIEKRYNCTRYILMGWTLFIGIGAAGGGIAMLAEPSGETFGFIALLPYMKTLPLLPDVLFKNFVFPGIMLLLVNCVTNLTAALLIWKRKKLGEILGTVFGFTLMMWITVQFVIFPMNVLSTMYFIFGVLQLISGIATLIFRKQSEFTFDPTEYSGVSSNSKTAVFYFSRLGYSRKIAYIIADRLGAQVQEITTSEPTKGNLGFWWCGRFAMHGWKMDINQIETDLTVLNKAVIVSPVWAFGISSPIKGFMDKYAEKLLDKDVSFVVNHFNPWLPGKIKKQVQAVFSDAEIMEYQTMWGRIHEKTI